jgi:hypothetical protein
MSYISMDLSSNIVTALAALLGSFIGAAMSLLGVKLTADKQDRQKREEVLREAANKRIEMLYEPLLNTLFSIPPYDDVHLDDEECKSIIHLIQKNERYASPDLLDIFWRFRYAYFNDFPKIANGLDSSLCETADAEYSALKELLGYGPILKKESKRKHLLKSISLRTSSRIDEWKRRRSSRKVRSRSKSKIP